MLHRALGESDLYSKDPLWQFCWEQTVRGEETVVKAEVERTVNRLLQKSNQEVEIQLAVETEKKWSILSLF